jgi:alkylation response protein AidB-like acyl-CoA dehydrogenase
VTIGLTEEQAALSASVSEWAAARELAEVVRAAEGKGPEVLLDPWGELADLGVLGVGVPESLGGAGGSLADLGCALEAAAQGLVPGPLLSTATGAVLLAEQPDAALSTRLLPGICGGSVRLGLAPQACPLRLGDERVTGTVPVVLDVGSATHLLVGAEGQGADLWLVVPVDADGVSIELAAVSPDLSRTVGSVRLVDVALDPEDRLEVRPGRMRDLLTVLAAAEASGTARWAMHTAVSYAGVREQFGRKIGSFQAVKHLCAQMLERAESATAVAWGAAVAHDDDAQLRFAAAVAGAVALDAAVENAKDCIQVLGGIGFTWEHDAHLYYKRLLTLQQAGGPPHAHLERLATIVLD